MNFQPIKMIDIEASHPIRTITGLSGYGSLKTLVRWHGAPLGYVQVPLSGDTCPAATLQHAIVEQHGWSLLRQIVAATLLPAPSVATAPLVTVAVCTRDRPADLARCLDSLLRLEYPALELLVIDNAPRDDTTAQLLRARYPQVRYVRETRPGLDWARNRAIQEARGEILAYTDDDVLVDPGWVRALVAIFAAHPDVMLVTGLVVPAELDTPAQVLFERNGGFTPGFKRAWYRVDRESGELAATHHGHMGRFGCGANMAYRRGVFAEVGPFDPALDVGTATNGGGDLEMFFRVLKAGHTLVYEPAALVRHRHRRDYAQLRTQIANDGIAFAACLVRCARAYPEERLALFRVWLWWMWWWLFRRLAISVLRPKGFPRDLIVAELRGAFVGLTRYQQARRNAARIARAFDSKSEATVIEEVAL